MWKFVEQRLIKNNKHTVCYIYVVILGMTFFFVCGATALDVARPPHCGGFYIMKT
jgi:hypothetical protein